MCISRTCAPIVSRGAVAIKLAGLSETGGSLDEFAPLGVCGFAPSRFTRGVYLRPGWNPLGDVGRPQPVLAALVPRVRSPF